MKLPETKIREKLSTISTANDLKLGNSDQESVKEQQQIYFHSLLLTNADWVSLGNRE
ncbi:hypothetical protein H6G04_10695 [Calothrix membranacea FACHB-236]|nr:hypothetical protein [Calothrix membranacea FACHB-236]